MAADDNENWLRKASPVEEYFDVGHRKKLNTVSYAVTLRSSSTNLPQLMEKALTLMYRKIPVLRVCFGSRDGQLWLREMKECNIEYEVVQGVRLEEQQQKMVRIFNTLQGPLWRVALMNEEDNLDPAWEKPFPHTYHIFLCLHHGISDGTTSVKIMGWLRMILNDLLAGRSVDPEIQLGEHVSYDAVMELYAEEEQKMRSDPVAMEEAMKRFSEGERMRPLLLDALPRPVGEGEATTRNIPLYLDEDQTRMMVAKCKGARVTLHSFLTCAINLALIDFLRENLPGEKRETYDLRAGHDVNLRRYYGGDTSRVLGVHLPIFSLRFSCQTPANLHKDFWAKAKEFHKTFHSALSNREPIRYSVLYQMEQERSQAIEDSYSDSGAPSYNFTLSNLGNIDEALSTGGDHVQIDSLCRYVALRNRRHFTCFQIHTFRGRLTVNMLYSTYYFSEEYAVRFADLVYSAIISRIE